MQVLKIQNKTALFLDHRVLINELYREATDTDNSYEIKHSCFHFYPKKDEKTIQSDDKISGGAKNQAKRKRRLQDEDAQEFRKWAEAAAEILKSSELIRDSDQSCQSRVPIALPEPQDKEFPTFKGANETKRFVKYLATELGKGTTYLIPPLCKFYNDDVTFSKIWNELAGRNLDLVVLDPPWRNKYIRRLKRSRKDLAYKMLDDSQIKDLPLARIIGPDTLVVVWCTNSSRHQHSLLNEFLPAWQLTLVHSMKWLKVDALNGLPIVELNADLTKKQPYEMIYIAKSMNSDNKWNLDEVREIDMLISVPSVVHSHKPPLLPWLRKYLKNQEAPNCLEVFARYLQPYHISFGLETLKLMQLEFYDEIEPKNDSSQS